MRGISLVSNNIANSNTTAFKKSYSNFSDIYSKNIGDNPKGFSGMGVINDSPRKQMFQGPLKQTDGALDLAVSGLGFLTFCIPSFLAYMDLRFMQKIKKQISQTDTQGCI